MGIVDPEDANALLRPIQDDVAGQHAEDTDDQRRPWSDEALMAHHTRGDDRHLLRYGQAEAARQEHQEHPEIGELLDE